MVNSSDAPGRRLEDAPTRAPVRRRAGWLIGTCLAALALLVAGNPAGPATGESSGVTVSATVPSATSVVKACPLADSTPIDLGLVPPGNNSISPPGSCSMTFGSSNDSSNLRMFQSDRVGVALSGAPLADTDDTFAGDGSFVTSMGTGTDRAWDGLVQPDGSVLLGGVGNDGTATDKFALARVDESGTLDPLFGGGDGKVFTQIGVGNDALYGLQLLPDGDIVASGYADLGGGTGNDVTFVRYDSDGDVDTAFGINGVSTFSATAGANTDYVLLMHRYADGRILGLGTSIDTPNSNWDTMLVRINADGTRDSSFGTNGVQIHQLGPAGSSDLARDMAIQPDGKIVVAGTVADGLWDGSGSTYSDMYVARFNPDGTLDNSFNGSGYQTLSLNTRDVSFAVAVQADGKIVTAGYTGAASNDVLVARFDAAGAPDNSFGINGAAVFTLSAATDFADGIVVLPDGKLLVTGGALGAVDRDVLVMRLTTSGAGDTTFGTNGVLLVPIGLGDNVHFTAGTADGKVIAGGASFIANDDMMAMRLDAASIADFDPFTSTWNGPSFFGACINAVTTANIVAPWTEDPGADCTANAGEPWQPVAATPTAPGALLATRAGAGDGTVQLQFGLRADSGQLPGSYWAPLEFEVTAPNV